LQTNGKPRHGVFSYPLMPIPWSAELDCQFHGNAQVKRCIDYYRSRAKHGRRRIYLSTTKAEAGLLDVLKQLTISRARPRSFAG
jgi:hypothetical protein